jgi:NDP-sugar pyrophosphorylase family protein
LTPQNSLLRLTRTFLGATPEDWIPVGGGLRHKTATVSAEAVVAFGALVGPGAWVERHVVLQPYSSVHDQCRVGEGSVVGLGARLQPGSVIGRDCRVEDGVIIATAARWVRSPGYFRGRYCDVFETGPGYIGFRYGLESEIVLLHWPRFRDRLSRTVYPYDDVQEECRGYFERVRNLQTVA